RVAALEVAIDRSLADPEMARDRGDRNSRVAHDRHLPDLGGRPRAKATEIHVAGRVDDDPGVFGHHVRLAFGSTVSAIEKTWPPSTALLASTFGNPMWAA